MAGGGGQEGQAQLSHPDSKAGNTDLELQSLVAKTDGNQGVDRKAGLMSDR